MRAPGRPPGRVVRVDQLGVGVLCDRAGRGGRDDALRRLRPGQRRDDVQPALQPALLAEYGPGLLGPPQVAVEGRVRDAGAHRPTRWAAEAIATARPSPALTWARLAPQGPTPSPPSPALCSSSRRHSGRAGGAPTAPAA